MKKRVVLALVVLALIGSLVAGWWWSRTAPEQVSGWLAGMGLEQSRAEAYVAWVAGTAPEKDQGPLIASGSIEGESISIVAEMGGRVVAVTAAEGDEVTAGQVLVLLDSRTLEAQKAQAEAAVVAAEAHLASVQAGPHPAEILAAQAALDRALAEREQARLAWQNAEALLAEPQAIDARVVEAETQVDLAQVQVEQAQAQRAAAEARLERYRAQGSMEEKYLYEAHRYQVEAAQAALDGAHASLTGAEEILVALRALRQNPLMLASQVRRAEGQFEVAAAGVGVAAAQLEELRAGPSPEAVAVAQAQVGQAQAAVGLLEAQIAKMRLYSPRTGIVTSRAVQAGETALAGETLLTVADLGEVTLTVYVPESELGAVYLGQRVEVTVDSFPDRLFQGTVAFIAQQAEFTPRNVQTQSDRVNMVFAVRIRLPNPERLLKPGMPADGTFR